MFKKTAAIILTIATIIAAATGWCVWRKQTVAKNKAAVTIQQETTNHAANGTGSRKQNKTGSPSTNKDIATRFEKDMRNWGVDSLADPHQWAKQPADNALAALHMPDVPDFPDRKMVGFSTDPEWGNNGYSYPCMTGLSNIAAYCMSMRTNAEWWKNEAWGTGSRWVGEPTVENVGKNKVKVTGTVRAILVSNGDTFQNGEYKALTPAWKDYPINDLLTIQDGKVVNVKYREGDYWWINPYFSMWDPLFISDNFQDGGTRIVIPVTGDLNWNGLIQTGVFTPLTAPASQDDPNVPADWSMWN